MSAAKDDPEDRADLAASIMAHRAAWASNNPSEAEMLALERLVPAKGDSREQGNAKAEVADEWRLFQSTGKPGYPPFNPNRLLKFVIWSYEFAAIHDSDKDLFNSLRAFNAELRAAAGLLFEFFLERSGLDRASLWELSRTRGLDNPAVHGHEAVGAYKMEWVLNYLCVDLLMDTVHAAELPLPRAAYKTDGKARVFEHRLAGLLDRTCGRPSHRLVLAISRALYPEATPIMDTILSKNRSHERKSRIKRQEQSKNQTNAAEASKEWEWEQEPDVTHHSWYGKLPDTRQGEREARKHGGYRRMVEQVLIELRNVEREASEFKKAQEASGGDMAARERAPVSAPTRPRQHAVGFYKTRARLI